MKKEPVKKLDFLSEIKEIMAQACLLQASANKIQSEANRILSEKMPSINTKFHYSPAQFEVRMPKGRKDWINGLSDYLNSNKN